MPAYRYSSKLAKSRWRPLAVQQLIDYRLSTRPCALQIASTYLISAISSTATENICCRLPGCRALEGRLLVGAGFASQVPGAGCWC